MCPCPTIVSMAYSTHVPAVKVGSSFCSIVTARVRSTTGGYVFTAVCLFNIARGGEPLLHPIILPTTGAMSFPGELSLRWGYPSPRQGVASSRSGVSSSRQGIPQSQAGGNPIPGGGYPSPRWGYPRMGQDWGTPPLRTGYTWTVYAVGGTVHLLWFPTAGLPCPVCKVKKLLYQLMNKLFYYFFIIM